MNTGQIIINTSKGTPELVVAMGTNSYLTIKAKLSNSGNIYVGESNVKPSNGFILDASEEITIYLATGEQTVYVTGDTNNDVASWIYWIVG